MQGASILNSKTSGARNVLVLGAPSIYQTICAAVKLKRATDKAYCPKIVADGPHYAKNSPCEAPIY